MLQWIRLSVRRQSVVVHYLSVRHSGFSIIPSHKSRYEKLQNRRHARLKPPNGHVPQGRISGAMI